MSDDVAIGQIVKPHGVRGDVRVRSLSDVPGRFESLRHATLLPPSGPPVITSVRSVRPAGDAYIVGFDAFSTPEDAARFRGALITVPHDPAAPRQPNEWYQCDLVGLTVRTEAGEAVGVLQEVIETPGHAVFVIRKGAHEVLVPATRAIVASVDLDTRLMTIRPVPGLLDQDDAL